MTTGHSPVGASVAERYFNCPGSVALCAPLPNPTTIDAATGTVAHTYAAQILKGEPQYAIGAVVDQDGFKITVDEEMHNAVMVYVDEVRDRCTPGSTLLVEHAFHLKQIHSDLWGTADAVIWQPNLRHLRVNDYKNGAGKVVEVVGNKQLKFYALGALLTCGFNAREVTVTIVQPRCPHPDGPVRSETFEAYDLLEWAADLRDAVLRTEAPDAPLVAGDHCKFCPAAAICPALTARALAVAQTEFTSVVPYDPAKLKLALDSRGAIKAWIKALDQFAYAEAMAGRLPDDVGYKLVAKRADRQYVSERGAEVALSAAGYTEDQYLEPRALKSPAQVEIAIGKAAFKAIEKDHVVKRSSGYTLAPVSDKRPAVRVLDVASEFASDSAIVSIEE